MLKRFISWLITMFFRVENAVSPQTSLDQIPLSAVKSPLALLLAVYPAALIILLRGVSKPSMAVLLAFLILSGI